MKKNIKHINFMIFAAILLAFASTLSAQSIAAEHAMGRVEIPVNPRRVVVLDYGTLDTFDALGISPALAVPKNYMPSYLEKYKSAEYANIGGLKEFNLETINAFKPDLIIISARQQDYYRQLSEIAPVYYVNTALAKDQISEAKKNIKFFGNLFGKGKEAAKALAQIDEAISRTRKKAQAGMQRALVLLTNDGKVSAFGSGSRFGFVYDALGLKQADPNIKAGRHGQLVNYEYIAMVNPDLILVVDRSAAIGVRSKNARVLDNPLVSRTKAAKDGKIVKLDPECWYLSGGGVQSLKQMVSEVENAVSQEGNH